MKAHIASISAVGSRANLDGHQITFDQPPSVPGGADRGASPLDVLVASIGACAHYFGAAYLHARGLPTDELTVDVEADKDKMPSPRIGRVAIRVRVPGGLAAQHITGIERAIRRCPAYGTLVHSPTVEMVVEEPSVTELAGNA